MIKINQNENEKYNDQKKIVYKTKNNFWMWE